MKQSTNDLTMGLLMFIFALAFIYLENQVTATLMLVLTLAFLFKGYYYLNKKEVHKNGRS